MVLIFQIVSPGESVLISHLYFHFTLVSLIYFLIANI